MSTDHRHLNPFFNRQRITDPSYFFGRQRPLEALYSAIATRQCRSLIGERKLGKSSLLTYLADATTLQAHGLDPERHVFIYVDLEGMSNVSYDEFWPEILDRLESSLPAGQEELRQMSRELSLAAEVRFTLVRRLLRRVERAGLTVVLMLDEFESLAANEAFNASFYGELRSLAGEMGVVYLTASKRSLYDLTYQHADTLSSPFFNIFSEERLGLMPEEEARGLLAGLSAKDGHEPFAAEEINQVVDLAGTHPFFLQVAGHYLYAAHEEELDGEQILATTARRFQAEAEDHYRYLWNQLHEVDQDALLRPERASPELVKELQTKALLKPGEGRRQPFSRAFADFLGRNPGRNSSTSAGSIRVSRSDTSDLTGATLGNYRVLNAVGRGGMAVVYKGYQPSLDRYVAIKVMSRQLVSEETFLERFQREAAGVAQLRHQNLVQMYDFGVHNDLSYMVMEYIDGETLKARLVELRQNGRRMPLDEVAAIIRDVAAALDYAHAHGIVHRDVKPANIMLRREERLARFTGAVPFIAVLTDFGVARMLEGVQLTGTGATIGTPDYMSPEQAQGQPAEATSDIYSLGIVLYEMLTGRLPFTADTPMAILLQHMQADPPSLLTQVPDLPGNLEWVLMQALAKRPDHRFTTAGRLSEALLQTTNGA
ncbi:MAG: protein kinase [Chloroflexi bacterium]|nr:protein kinase [Chloroflexota bacterium]MCI0576927.1 protein kinase [Chloroflexota bacterium]MCI0646925.1 protein kinase [Chloroflexota bacterium]MCI0731311.1 protein kinase [Chloroflexota bacterium]